jgi:hypothetical protein
MKLAIWQLGFYLLAAYVFGYGYGTLALVAMLAAQVVIECAE